MRPSYDPSCAIFCSFNFIAVIFNITSEMSGDAEIERTKDRATQIITWTHFSKTTMQCLAYLQSKIMYVFVRLSKYLDKILAKEGLKSAPTRPRL